MCTQNALRRELVHPNAKEDNWRRNGEHHDDRQHNPGRELEGRQYDLGDLHDQAGKRKESNANFEHTSPAEFTPERH